jgi:hypothetical protein
MIAAFTNQVSGEPGAAQQARTRNPRSQIHNGGVNLEAAGILELERPGVDGESRLLAES